MHLEVLSLINALLFDTFDPLTNIICESLL